MAAQLNCWEVRACGREPGGARVEKLGVCPATTFEDLDGRNGGVNGGRACWCVPDTGCEGEQSLSFAQKVTDCLACDFFLSVDDEEHLMDIMMMTLHFGGR